MELGCKRLLHTFPLSFFRKRKEEVNWKERKGKKSEITPKFERNAKQLRNIELNAKHPWNPDYYRRQQLNAYYTWLRKHTCAHTTEARSSVGLFLTSLKDSIQQQWLKSNQINLKYRDIRINLTQLWNKPWIDDHFWHDNRKRMDSQHRGQAHWPLSIKYRLIYHDQQQSPMNYDLWPMNYDLWTMTYDQYRINNDQRFFTSESTMTNPEWLPRLQW